LRAQDTEDRRPQWTYASKAGVQLKGIVHAKTKTQETPFAHPVSPGLSDFVSRIYTVMLQKGNTAAIFFYIVDFPYYF